MVASFFLSFKKSAFYPLFYLFFLINVGLSLFFAFGIWGQLRIFTNISESMRPVIEFGDLAVVSKQNMNSYEPGDIVSFYSYSQGSEEIITHRIEKLGGNVYITKGDNNKYSDAEPLRPRLIIGKIIAVIPYVGLWVMAVNSLPGKIIFIIIPMIVIVFTELSSISSSKVKTNPSSISSL